MLKHIELRAAIARSAEQLTRVRRSWDLIPIWERFSALSKQALEHTKSLYNGYRVIPVGNAAGEWN
jgi:hypothetical protein